MKNIAYFDHAADIGIIGYGKTLEKAFEAAAAAVFNIITPVINIHPTSSFEIQFMEPDIELALVTWLNLLIAEAQIRNLVLGKFKLKHEGANWIGKAWGENWHADLKRGTDVKGATLTMLSVKQIDHLWEAKCVVDV